MYTVHFDRNDIGRLNCCFDSNKQQQKIIKLYLALCIMYTLLFKQHQKIWEFKKEICRNSDFFFFLGYKLLYLLSYISPPY